MLTAEQLQVIKERAEKATEGPWNVEALKYDGQYAVKDKLGWYIAVHHHDVKQDVDFIAHARQDIPALVAEMEQLVKALEISENENRKLHELLEEFAGDVSEFTAQVLRKRRQMLAGESND